ncbi:class I SAM-dependent methyltransferase [Psychromarinibacter sp. S121]|uniref:class I SAM-dependent methyltransferase n=1 Tax=Psychromarinibacter sp. S121 TaxID=3415127 RepID=UPI003C7C6848
MPMMEGGLDVSPLSRRDRMNVVLQRSDVLGYSRAAYDVVRDWEAGDDEPLQMAVAENGADYVNSAAEIISEEFEEVRGLLERVHHKRIADIGCGYGLFGLFAARALNCDLLLIDIEKTKERHFGFAEQGAGYADLSAAVDFLSANGVARDRIATWNPLKEDLPDGPRVDIAVSFLSCGFHYPVDMYLPFFEHAVTPRGAIVLDLRASEADENIAKLENVGKVRVLQAKPGLKRVLVKKWDKS